jgi:ferredoxin
MPNITHYRSKCIGCGICYEMMPDIWRMSTKDGKATLVKAVLKKQNAVLSIGFTHLELSKKVALACPVNVIKVNE